MLCRLMAGHAKGLGEGKCATGPHGLDAVILLPSFLSNFSWLSCAHPQGASSRVSQAPAGWPAVGLRHITDPKYLFTASRPRVMQGSCVFSEERTKKQVAFI